MARATIERKTEYPYCEIKNLNRINDFYKNEVINIMKDILPKLRLKDIGMLINTYSRYGIDAFYFIKEYEIYKMSKEKINIIMIMIKKWL